MRVASGIELDEYKSHSLQLSRIAYHHQFLHQNTLSLNYQEQAIFTQFPTFQRILSSFHHQDTNLSATYSIQNGIPPMLLQRFVAFVPLAGWLRSPPLESSKAPAPAPAPAPSSAHASPFFHSKIWSPGDERQLPPGRRTSWRRSK